VILDSIMDEFDADELRRQDRRDRQTDRQFVAWSYNARFFDQEWPDDGHEDLQGDSDD
jgi:hypothetical protein